MPDFFPRQVYKKTPGTRLYVGHSSISSGLTAAWVFNHSTDIWGSGGSGNTSQQSLINFNDIFSSSDNNLAGLGGVAAQVPSLTLGGPRGENYYRFSPTNNSLNAPYGSIAAPSSRLTPSSAVTLHWVGWITGDCPGSSQNNPPIIQIGGGVGVFRKTNNSGNVNNKDLFYIDGTGGSFANAIAVTGGITAYNTYSSATHTVKNGAQIAYWNGIKVGNSSHAGAITYSGAAELNSNSHKEVSNANYYAIYIWNRILSPTEISLLHNQPYAPLEIDTKSNIFYSLGATVSNVTTPQTQTGKSRIQKAAVQQTQTGKSRIKVSTTQTQTGKSNVRNTTLKTQTGKSRIQKAAVQQTQTGKSRVQKTDIQTQSGLSRIQATNLQTQTGKTNIYGTAPRTQFGQSRIQVTTTKTQPGVSDIQAKALQTQTGLSFINKRTLQTQTGKSRIRVTTTKTQTGKSRIQKTDTQTQSGLSRIEKIISKTQTGLSRIQSTTLQTITGLSLITGKTSQTQLGKSAVQKTVLRTQLGKASIRLTRTRTQTGLSFINKRTLQTQTGLSRITALTNRTQTGKANVRNTTNKIQFGKAAIRLTRTKTQTGISHINLRAVHTITGRSKITALSIKTITGKARIVSKKTKTQLGVSNIIKNVLILSVDPEGAVVNNGKNIIVTVGTGGGLFDMTDTVYFQEPNGVETALTTVYINSNTLKATIPFALLNIVGVAGIFVRD